MLKKTDSKAKTTVKGKMKKAIAYNLPDDTMDFYISEETAAYGNNGKKPFSVYYDDHEHSLRQLH